MAYIPKEGAISIFRTEKPKKSEKHPDYRGNAMYKGEKLAITLWVQEPRGGGTKYQGGSIQPWVEKEKVEEPKEPINPAVSEKIDDDIPF